jgi:hypothetical protein
VYRCGTPRSLSNRSGLFATSLRFLYSLPCSFLFAIPSLSLTPAQEALALADEAEALARGLRDPAKRRKVLEAVELLRSLAGKVLEAARAAAENPHDPEVQRALDEAQQQLNFAIRGVILLTSAQEAALQRELELLEQAARMDEDDANAYLAAQDTMRLVRDFLAQLASMSPKEVGVCSG